MSDNEQTASGASDTPPRWLQEVAETVGALRELAQAQWQLLRAELRLARAAALMLLVALILAATCAAALGLTLLALLGVAFAYWFGSWILSLGALAVLLILALAVTLIVARRCLHWLSLPGTRAQWHSMVHQQPLGPSPAPDTRGSNGEKSDENDASQAG